MFVASRYNAPHVRAARVETKRFSVATQWGVYPHTDAGVEMRRVFHKLRSAATGNFHNEGSTRPSSMHTVRFPRRGGSTPNPLLRGRFLSTS